MLLLLSKSLFESGEGMSLSTIKGYAETGERKGD